MDPKQKQFAIWAGIAGLIFMAVGIHDLLNWATVDKSVFVVSLEFVAGTFFILNFVVQVLVRRT